MFCYDSMNLLQKVLQLPFVASSNTFQPFINTGLLVLGLFGVVKKTLITNFTFSSADNEIMCLLKNTTLVVKNLFNMLFIDESGNAASELSHILAGKIDFKHLIPNTGERIYVLAFSEGTLASL